MIDGFDPSILGTLSPSAICALFVVGLLVGRLIPYKIHKEVRDDRDRWQQAYEREREARQLQLGQIEKLLDVTETTRDLIAALPKAKD